MGNKTTSIGMSKLLANASKMEKEIKETENVAPTITVEAEQTKQNGEEQPQGSKKEVIKPEENVLSEKKKNKDEQEDKEKNKSCNRKEEYSLLFQERKKKEVEMIRISKETHAKLKRLANVSDVSMHVLATNILEIAFEKYNKEIQAAVKKYMSL
jgi:hypothetical protein